MSVRSIILTAMTISVAGALALLFAEAGETPEADVSERALKRAKQRHARAQSGAPATARESSRPPDQMKQWKPPDPEQAAAKRTIRSPDTSALMKARGTPSPRSGDSDRPGLRVPAKRPASADADSAELQSQMREVNRLYDRRDYEGALAAAKEMLAVKPGNVRMLRVVVSSACVMGNEEEARASYKQLPPRHQRQMARRCSRYGVDMEAE